MKKRLLFASLVSLLAITSCNKNSDGIKDGTKVFLNDFETMQDVYRLNALKVGNNTRGKVDINKDKKFVTSGEASMHLKTTTGSKFEFMQYFDTSASGNVDISNIREIEFDVYNASNFASTCTLTLYCDDDLDSLLTVQTDLPKKSENSKFNHMSFPISKIALSYNVNRIRGVAFAVTAYENAEFYFDNLTLTYGARLTDEDKKYSDTIDKLIEQIDKLNQESSFDDRDNLEKANDLYISLPTFYRSMIPNIDKFNQAMTSFADLNRPFSINYDKDTLLPFDEFYGYSLLSNFDSNSNMSFAFDKEHKFNGENGSAAITFNGSIYSGFSYHGFLEGSYNKFDYVTFTMKYETTDNRGLSIWIGGTNRIVLYPNVETSFSLSTKILSSNSGYFLVHQQGINENNDLVDPILSSIGTLYLSNFIAYGRSVATLKEDALKAIVKVPNSSSLKDEPSILKYLTVIKECQTYYENEELMKKYPDLFTNEQKENLLKCIEACKEYGLVYGTDEKTNSYVYWYYGVPFESSIVENETFGSVFENIVTNNRKEQKEQFFRIGGRGNEPTLYDVNFVYIYNPTEYEFVCSIKDTDWINFTYAKIHKLAPKTWTKVEFAPEVFLNSASKDIAIGIYAEGNPSESIIPLGGVDGNWLISSIFGYNRITPEKIIAEIDALPEVSEVDTEMEQIKYSNRVNTIYTKFGYLPSNEQAIVGNARTNKLLGLYKAVNKYNVIYNEEVIKGFDYSWDGSIDKIEDEEIGGAYRIQVDEIHPEGGLNGIQLLLHSENIKPKAGTTTGFFYIYNPTDDIYYGSFYPDNWGTYYSVALMPKTWTKVEFDITKFGVKVCLLMIDLIPNNTTWKMSYLYSK